MSPLRCKRSWIVILILEAALLLASLFSATASPSSPVQNFQKADVMILIAPGQQGMDSVSISYPKLVDKPTAEADFKRLATTAGWNAAGEIISNERSTNGNHHPMTSVDFTVQHAVDINSGVLKIEPIILSFKRFKSIQILYFMPQAFSFQGLETFENDNVRIDLARSGDTYHYDVAVKNSDFTALNLPLEGKQSVPTQGRHSSTTAIIIFIAVIAAVLVYIITDIISKRSRRSSNRRS
jgi:hypothetical protein